MPSVGCRSGDPLVGSVVAKVDPTLLTDETTKVNGFSPCAVVLLTNFDSNKGHPQSLRLHAETDGTFKTKLPFHAWLKAKIPKIEVDATLPVPPDILPQIFLAGNRPWPISYPPVGFGFSIVLPSNGLPTHAVLEPLKVAWDEEGYWVDSKFHLVSLTQDEADSQTAAVESLVAQARRPQLKLGSLKITVAGVGPNNDIVKALVAIGDSISNAYNDAKKTEKNVQATVVKANEDFAREMARIPHNIERAPRNVEREAGKYISKRLGVKGVKIPRVIRMPSTRQLPPIIRRNIPRIRIRW